MRVLVWVVEGTWRAAVAAAAALAPADAEIVLLHVADEDVPTAAHGAFAGLLGRGHPERDPGTAVERAARESAAELLTAAAAELGRPATSRRRQGRVEREVVAAAEDCDLLVLSRDADPEHPGPHSLGPRTRFVVDHAPCAVLLTWPGRSGRPR